MEFNNNANVSTYIEKLVLQILEKNRILKGNKLFGTITEVISQDKVNVYIEQELRSQIISCPPRVVFEVGDRVLIENINNNPHDRFIIATVKGVESNIEIIDYSTLPTFPVELTARDDTTGKAQLFTYGYDDPSTLWTQELRYNDKGQLVTVVETYPDGMIFYRNLIRDSEGRFMKYE